MLNLRHIKFLLKAVVQLYKQLVDHQKRQEQVVFVIMELITEKEAQEMANHLMAQEIGAVLKAFELPASGPPAPKGPLN